jgi:enoyl-CoA hydratase/carnithine racemase
VIGEERQGPVLRLALDNPPANALSLEVVETLQAALDAARDDDDTRVIVIAGSGKLFSAGHDLKQMTAHRADADGGRAYFEQTFAACATLMQGIVEHPKPIIAEVDGVATAAGCQLVATCDLAIASDRSQFAVNGINVGLFCTTPAVALTRNIGAKRAMEMLLTGEMIDAATALEFGLVNRVVPPDYLADEVAKVAATISSKSPQAIRMGKQAVRRQVGLSLSQAYETASRTMVENLLASDANEGISAFFEKRAPDFN